MAARGIALMLAEPVPLFNLPGQPCHAVRTSETWLCEIQLSAICAGSLTVLSQGGTAVSERYTWTPTQLQQDAQARLVHLTSARRAGLHRED